MTLQTEFYSRKPFIVEAIRVQDDNLEEIAAWCGGEVRIANRPSKDEGATEKVSYIKVKVFQRAKNDRQTRGYPGDWVLLSESGFKVYTDRAFKNAFEDMEGVVVHRDAETGRFVTEDYADANPSTTVAEKV